MIKSRKGLKILIMTILLSAIFVSFYLYNKNLAYQSDVTYVYSIAKKLGYNQINYINFYRNQCIGIDCYYDTLNLVFITNEDTTTFAKDIDGLLFTLQKTYGPWIDTEFLYSVNREYVDPKTTTAKNKLSLQPQQQNDTSYNYYRTAPMVTKWELVDGQRSIEIKYADANANGDIWKYGTNSIQGNIVVVVLNRHLQGQTK